jgi:glucan phosphoethanolaminetransferase (alkaline phosphatase superfamily)
VENTNFSYLLLALLIFLFGVPLADDLSLLSGPLVRLLLISCLLIIGVASLKGSGRLYFVAIAFVVAGIIFNTVAVRIVVPELLYGAYVSLLAFLLIAVWWALKQVAIGTEISTNRLIGAVSVYLLLGVIWAMAYTLLDLFSPGSFQGLSSMDDPGWESEWLYFSFVTMTTLGYGDLLPVSATARALAYMQAVAGQFYIAVLVAGLVSAYISSRQNQSPK